MKIKIIDELLTKYNNAILEKHVIFVYLKSKNLSTLKNTIITKFLNNFIEICEITAHLEKLNYSNIKDLEKYLEYLIPSEHKKSNGIFFTPNYIIDFIIKELNFTKKDKILEPSCGYGSFILRILNYYKINYGQSIKETLKNNIFAIDILEKNINICKILISIFALENDEIILDEDFNFYIGDTLNMKFDLSFDKIIGNPPFIKIQDLDSKYKLFLNNTFKTTQIGNYNIYFAFFEQCYNLLSKEGNLGFITPNGYISSQFGKSLRNFFNETNSVYKIINFSHNKIFDVSAYTCITFLNRKTNDNIMYERIDETINSNTFNDITYSKNNNLKGNLLKKQEFDNVYNIENCGLKLESIFDISTCITTNNNNIYLVEKDEQDYDYCVKNTNNGNFKIEIGCTKEIYLLSKLTSNEEISNNKNRIIFPYKNVNNKFIPYEELEFKQLYPKCYSYLLSKKEELLKRDKGKKKLIPFYMWSRTQNIHKLSERLSIRTYNKSPNFLKFDENSYNLNSYNLFLKPNQNNLIDFNLAYTKTNYSLSLFQKILNSKIMSYYISKTSVSLSGGYYCYQKHYIKNFSIPIMEINELNYLNGIVNSKEIDDFLIEKYKLYF